MHAKLASCLAYRTTCENTVLSFPSSLRKRYPSFRPTPLSPPPRYDNYRPCGRVRDATLTLTDRNRDLFHNEERERERESFSSNLERRNACRVTFEVERCELMEGRVKGEGLDRGIFAPLGTDAYPRTSRLINESQSYTRSLFRFLCLQYLLGNLPPSLPSY